MSLTDMKVSTRLTSAFGSLILLIAVMGGVSMVKVNTVDDSFHKVVDDDYPKIHSLNEVEGDLNQIARSMRNTLIMSNAADIKNEVERIDGARKRIAEKLEAVQARIKSEKGKAVLAKVAEARAKYLPQQGRFMELAAAGKGDEAKALLLGELRPSQLGYFDALEELIRYEEGLMDESAKDANAAFASVKAAIWTSGGIALVIAVLMGLWITRSLTRQLGAEPGTAADLARSVAQGDLSVAIDLKPGDSSSLMAQLQVMQTSLAKVVTNVRQNSESVATASAQIAQGNQDLSQRTEEQASALEETAASMEQLSSTVKQNADNANQANQLALGASSVAIQGGDVVAQVVTTMKGINDSSKKIADIISVIDGIAFQTNILALNAAVEAARAGEQGRGFAVVASEVRNLASRSAEAAKEIKSLITASVERVEQGSALVDRAGATMTEVVGSIKRVTDIMAEISAASTEQSAGVAQVGEAISQMDQVTQQNAALVEESAAAAESLKVQAHQLVAAVAVFKLGAAGLSDAAAARPVATGPSTFPAVDRRGPARAKNVERPRFGAKAAGAVAVATAAATVATAAPAGAGLAPRTGTDDWASF